MENQSGITVLVEYAFYCGSIAYIEGAKLHLAKLVNPLKIGRSTDPSQRIHQDYNVAALSVASGRVASDKSGATCNNYFHLFLSSPRKNDPALRFGCILATSCERYSAMKISTSMRYLPLVVQIVHAQSFVDFELGLRPLRPKRRYHRAEHTLRKVLPLRA